MQLNVLYVKTQNKDVGQVDRLMSIICLSLKSEIIIHFFALLIFEMRGILIFFIEDFVPPTFCSKTNLL